MKKLSLCKQAFTLSIIALLSTSNYAQSQADIQNKQLQARNISVKTGEVDVLPDIHDGIWLVQFSQRMLQTILDNLQTLNTLAVQSLNGAATSDEVSAMKVKFTAIRDEINRITAVSTFNGAYIFKNAEHTVKVPIYHHGYYKILLPASFRDRISELDISTRDNTEKAIGTVSEIIQEEVIYLSTLGYIEMMLTKLAADGDVEYKQ